MPCAGGGGGCGLRLRRIQTWIRDYDNLQWLALKLIYTQIGCALVGSLGPLYNGVLLVDLGISLFALVAIESSSQSLARTYALLLFCSIFLDISWFFIFSHHTWNMPSEFYGAFGKFLVKLTLAMQIIGSSVRLSSSLLWIQMYRLGSSYLDNSGARDTDVDLRNSFINPATPLVRVPSGCDDVIGGSIYDPAYYSSLFENGSDDIYSSEVSQNREVPAAGSVSAAETSQLNPPMGSFFDVKDDENDMRKLQLVI
ncbi:hypothetical protein CASFOL_005755 [Castilleja foliolosa]|uniref:Uncharacterized protein n=1 Tax=Castilleja foliolosa TaxID=1961234 RepID=A0ABD3E5G5_9LAMI